MPEAVQTIDIKLIGALLFFGLMAMIVTFSVVNTFMMTVFERTAEFGMLMAIGMKPGRIMQQLSLEALFLSVLGVVLGVAVSSVILLPLAQFGMPLPESATEMLTQYNMPDRMYPSFQRRCCHRRRNDHGPRHPARGAHPGNPGTPDAAGGSA